MINLLTPVSNTKWFFIRNFFTYLDMSLTVGVINVNLYMAHRIMAVEVLIVPSPNVEKDLFYEGRI